jgi:hypothetical protein
MFFAIVSLLCFFASHPRKAKCICNEKRPGKTVWYGLSLASGISGQPVPDYYPSEMTIFRI